MEQQHQQQNVPVINVDGGEPSTSTIIENVPNEPPPPPSGDRNQYGRVVILLENPILPDDMIKNTPSKADGLDPEVENDLRITGCKLIQISGILLRLPQVAMATGQVLFQRFYYSKSFVRLPMEITAMACVVLASKVEEAPRRIRDVMNVFHNMKQIRLGQPTTSMMLDEKYVSLKNQIIKAERRILKELGFCVHVKHPHKFIVAVAKTLRNEENTELIQAAWSYMNDSLRTNVFVRFPPETIACACIHLSARILKVPLPTQPAWYEIFNIDSETIQTVCKDILSLYTRKILSQEELEEKVEFARQIRIENKAAAELKKALKEQQQAAEESTTETVIMKPIETQPISDHSSISSPASFKLQKSPAKTELTSTIKSVVTSSVGNDNNNDIKMEDRDMEDRNEERYNSHRLKNGHHHYHHSDGVNSPSVPKNSSIKDRIGHRISNLETIQEHPTRERSPPKSYVNSGPRTPSPSYDDDRSPESDHYRRKERSSSSSHHHYHHRDYYRSNDYDSRSRSRNYYHQDYDEQQYRSSSRRYEERQRGSSGEYYSKKRSRSRSPNYSSSSSSRYSSSHYHHKSARY